METSMLGHFVNSHPFLSFTSRPMPLYCPRARAASVSSAIVAPPMKTSSNVVHKPSYWDFIHADVESHLEKSFPSGATPAVGEPLRHLTLVVPRSSAPALCVAACELAGGTRDQALNAAVALHMTHAAAFLHENLPLEDRSSSIPAGPRPTAHLGTDPNIELLTGDAMIPLALELLAKSDNPASETISKRILRVIVELTRAIGSQGVVSRQYYRSISGHALCPSKSSYGNGGGGGMEMWGKREGGFHACAGACGAILGGGTEDEIERLREFGFYVGMIQGIKTYGRVGGHEEEEEAFTWKKVEEDMRRMAIKNLRGFNESKAMEILSYILKDPQSNFCYA